ncbi:UNVERIFIED_ORG: hypothetical protein J2Y78_004924 [Buttiauxella agrestis ATCC 33320]
MSTTIKTFKFNPVDINGHDLQGSAQLYANGLHQVKLRVSLEKQVDGASTPLTQEELNSLQIVNKNQNVMITGWSSSSEYNGYTFGLCGLNNTEGTSVNPTNQTLEDTQDLYFYLSTTDATLEPQDFEASINVNGVLYRSGNSTYNYSYVTIKPTMPYFIYSDELERQEDMILHNEIGKDQYENLTVVYWTLPNSLSIKSYIFPDYIGNSVVNIGTSKAGADPSDWACALMHGYTEFLYAGLGVSNSVDFGDTVIIQDGESIIRGTYANTDGHYLDSPSPDSPCDLVIIDEYGCTSNFVIYSVDNASDIDIRDNN